MLVLVSESIQMSIPTLHTSNLKKYWFSLNMDSDQLMDKVSYIFKIISKRPICLSNFVQILISSQFQNQDKQKQNKATNLKIGEVKISYILNEV